MTDALLGPPKREPTLRERANAPRIGRARFIGNAVGYLLVVLIVAAAVVLAKVPSLTETVSLRSSPMPLTVPNAWVRVGLTAVLMLFVGELAIRRRHDRAASSIDVIVWLELVLGAVVLQNFAPRFEYSLWIDGVLAAIGLYFIVVLCILPGTRGPNRYGPDPRH